MRVCTRSFASRLDSGSSIRNTCGFRTIARPIATRCLWPPESARGFRSRYSLEVEDLGRLEHSLSISAFETRAIFRREAHVVGDRHVRIEGVVLEHHRHVAILRSDVRDVLVTDEDGSFIDALEPADHRRLVDFPHPDGPTSTRNSPSWIVERERVDSRAIRVREDPGRLVKADGGHRVLAFDSAGGETPMTRWFRNR